MHPDSLPPKATNAIRSFLERLQSAYPDARAFLYGSFARGDWLEDSDVDMVVLSSAFNEELVERMSKLRRLAPYTVAFQILAYTPEEIDQLLGRSLAWQEIASYWRELPMKVHPDLKEVLDG